MPITWAELAARTLARQFPAISGRTVDDIGAALSAIGPIQAQTARSPFLGLAARLPGLTHETITAAYEELRMVRGSSVRGTVHCSTGVDHAILDAVTRLGQRALWARTLRLAEASLEEVWGALEDYAARAWRTPGELGEHLRSWLAAHDPNASPRLHDTAGRYFAFGHGGLLRRPLRGPWSGQGAPGYHAAVTLLGEPYAALREALLADPDAAADALVRRHVTAYGPSSRHDIAWFSGLGLRTIDAALARAAGELTPHDGPDGRTYWDLREPPEPLALPGARLLPEFDALLCGFDPPARERFVDPANYRTLWHQDNGLLLAPLPARRAAQRLLAADRHRTAAHTRHRLLSPAPPSP